MSNLRNAQDLYQKMGQGQMKEAFEKYYHNDVVVEEPTGEVRKGKEAQREAIKQWEGMVQEMHDGGVKTITASEDGNTTMVDSWMDVTFKDGNRRNLEEIAVQDWKDGQIVKERFFYWMSAEEQQAAQEAMQAQSN